MSKFGKIFISVSVVILLALGILIYSFFFGGEKEEKIDKDGTNVGLLDKDRDGIEGNYDDILSGLNKRPSEGGLLNNDIGNDKNNEKEDIENEDIANKKDDIEGEKKEDNKGLPVGKVEKSEGGLYISKGKNSSTMLGVVGSEEVKFGKEEEVVKRPSGNSSNGTGQGHKGNGGIKSTNEVDISKLPSNKNADKVKSIYKKELNLQVVPSENGSFGVFNQEMHHVFSAESKIMFIGSSLKYDNLVAEVLAEIGIGLTKEELESSLKEMRRSGDVYKYKGVTFSPGNDTSIRW